MKDEERKGIYFIVVSILLIVATSIIAFQVENYNLKKNNKPTIGFLDFLNRETKSILRSRTILIGIVFGFMFGLIEIWGIWGGLEYLKFFMPEGQLTQAALGEIYSSIMAVFIGTFLSHAAKIIYKPHQKIPIWTDALGVTIGGLFALFVARIVSTRK